jgi:hypothetical protein
VLVKVMTNFRFVPVAVRFGESVDDGIDEHLQAEEGAPGNMSLLKVKPAHLKKNGRSNRRREVAATRMVETGKEALVINNVGIQRDEREEHDNGVAICTSTPYSKPSAAPANEELTGVAPVTGGPGSAASTALPCYSVGREISLPFDQVLPQCHHCTCSALIAWSGRSDPKAAGVVCLDHGLQVRKGSDIRDLVLRWDIKWRYRFISPEHEAALRAFLA